jgi:hypothetical protein
MCVLWDECLFAEDMILTVIFDKLLEEFSLLETAVTSDEASSMTYKRNAEFSDAEIVRKF